MAVTPDQAYGGKNAPVNHDDLIRQVKRVDNWLRSHPPTADNSWYIDMADVDPGIVTKLIAAYQKVGWRAETSSDRDGFSLVLTRK